MTEYQRLFLVQARTDLVVFELLKTQKELPACHALHYLQMATELLGKAHKWQRGPCKKSHKAFLSFVRSLAKNGKAQKQLGFHGQNAHWQRMLEESTKLAGRIEALAPAEAGDGPNPEYPWPIEAPKIAPVEHTFEIWQDLKTTSGRRFLKMIHHLFAAAEAYL